MKCHFKHCQARLKGEGKGSEVKNFPVMFWQQTVIFRGENLFNGWWKFDRILDVWGRAVLRKISLSLG